MRKPYKVLINNEWHEIDLSPAEYELIQESISGNTRFNAEFKLNNNRLVKMTEISSIKKLPKPIHWVIPVKWFRQEYGEIIVKAQTLDEAMKKVEDGTYESDFRPHKKVIEETVLLDDDNALVQIYKRENRKS